jgi:hypothetical protein
MSPYEKLLILFKMFLDKILLMGYKWRADQT